MERAGKTEQKLLPDIPYFCQIVGIVGIVGINYISSTFKKYKFFPLFPRNYSAQTFTGILHKVEPSETSLTFVAFLNLTFLSSLNDCLGRQMD